MDKVQFKDVVKAAKDTAKGGLQLWNVFTACVAANAESAFKMGEKDEGKALKAWFQTEEAKVKTDDFNLNSIGAYRSTKSVIGAAARYGVPIVVDGKPRGKTDVEKAIKELRQPETAMTTINRSLKTINGKVTAVTDPVEIHSLYSQVKALHEQVKNHAAEVLKLSEAKLDKALEKKAA